MTEYYLKNKFKETIDCCIRGWWYLQGVTALAGVGCWLF